MQHSPITRDIGLRLAEAAWQRPADEAEHSIADQVKSRTTTELTQPVDDELPAPAAGTATSRLPLSDVALHVGIRADMDSLSCFAGLLRRIDRVARATGRHHPTPAEQDAVTGCLRQLLPGLASANPDDERVRAAFRPALNGGPAVRRALDAAWIAVLG